MNVLDELQNTEEERFLEIYETLAQQGFGPLDAEVAKALRFRPQAVRKIPMAQRARKARAIVLNQRNGELAYELFGSYLMHVHTGLVTGFLDRTGVEHEDGMLEDLERSKPAPEKIGPAVEELDKEFPPADVTTYLALCAQQWPDISEFEALWRRRTGQE